MSTGHIPALQLRPEQPAEASVIDALHHMAFGRSAEGEVVARLRAAGALAISLVAVVGERLIGHVAFSPVTSAAGVACGLGLGPVAVDADHRRRGIGARLVQAGLERARADGWPAVFVVGDFAYYGRFDFVPATSRGLHCKWPGTTDYFLMLELRPDSRTGTSGLVQYHPAFDAV